MTTDGDELKRYARLHFADRAEKIHAEHDHYVAALATDFAARGVATTGYLNALQRALIERAVRLARAHIESIEEAHRVCRRPIDEGALHRMETGAIDTILGAGQAIFGDVLQRAEATRLGAEWRSHGHAAVTQDLGIETGKIRREFEMRRIALRVGNKVPIEKRWDVFISHASEDKRTVALPLADALTAKGVKVWIDVGELRLGDSLRRKIDEGLAQSRYGVVVCSPAFFEKPWPQYELDALFSREVKGQKVILPVLHGMTPHDLVERSPLASGKLHIEWSRGIDEVVRAIVEVVRGR